MRTTPPSKLDIAANRAMGKWSGRAQVGRLLWETLRRPLFAWTPRPIWAWRNAVLRAFGAQLGRKVRIDPSARIAIPWNLRVGDNSAIGDRAIVYNLGPIIIGADATISQNVHLCAGGHDFRRADMKLIKAPIAIGSGAWICADAFVGPGVTIGPMAVVGARAVVVRNVAENKVVAGNPARIVGERWPKELG